MENNFKQIQVKAKITEAIFLGFNTTSIADNLLDLPPDDSYEFLNELTYEVIKDKRTIATNVKITILNKDNKNILGFINTKISILIDNFDESVIRINEGKTELLPFAFMVAASTAISTTRGMLVMASSNSKISNAILPLIDATKFIPNSNNSILKA